MAARRHFTSGPLDHDAAVELCQLRKLCRWHTIIDNRLDRIRMGRGEVVLEEVLQRDDPFPWAGVMPDELAVHHLIGLAVLIDHKLGSLAGCFGPALDVLRSLRHGVSPST